MRHIETTFAHDLGVLQSAAGPFKFSQSVSVAPLTMRTKTFTFSHSKNSPGMSELIKHAAAAVAMLPTRQGLRAELPQALEHARGLEKPSAPASSVKFVDSENGVAWQRVCKEAKRLATLATPSIKSGSSFVELVDLLAGAREALLAQCDGMLLAMAEAPFEVFTAAMVQAKGEHLKVVPKEYEPLVNRMAKARESVKIDDKTLGLNRIADPSLGGDCLKKFEEARRQEMFLSMLLRNFAWDDDPAHTFFMFLNKGSGHVDVQHFKGNVLKVLKLTIPSSVVFTFAPVFDVFQSLVKSDMSSFDVVMKSIGVSASTLKLKLLQHHNVAAKSFAKRCILAENHPFDLDMDLKPSGSELVLSAR